MIESSGTMVMMVQQHGDRWKSYSDRAGLDSLSSLLRPEQLRQYEPLKEFDDELLKEISPDLAIAKWQTGALLFDKGAYIDVAFFIIDGTVQLGDHKLGAGEIFGEIGAMIGWAQTAPAKTLTPCTLLQVRAPSLRKMRRKSRKLKQRLDETYRTRALDNHLASTPLLSGLDPQVVAGLVARCELVSCEPDEVIAREGEAIDSLMLVRSGALKLSQKLGVGEIVVAYAPKGSTLGESELLVDPDAAYQATAAAVGHCEIVKVPKADFLAVSSAYPAFEQRLWEIATKRIKDMGTTKGNLQRSDLLDFSLAKGLTSATSVLVIDLEKCTRCDDCMRGCASTHQGVPRFVREGEVYDNFLVARSCYHCEDPYCLTGCPTGAISRIGVGDVVEINHDICIGCGACAESCPFDQIVMHDLGSVWAANAMPRHLRGTARAVASKCDLCRTSPQGPACVSSCPHGAAGRVAGAEEFDVLLAARRRGAAAS